MCRATTLFSCLLATVSLASCGGSSPSAPAAPASPSQEWTLPGRIVATVTGTPVPNATISVAGMDATTDSDGRFELSQQTAPALPVEASISAAGYLTRTTRIASSGQQIDLIPTSGGFDLTFYRALARNSYDSPSDLDAVRTWSTAPRYYVRTVYADDLGRAVDADVLTLLRSELPAATAIFSGGRFATAPVDTGAGERQRTDGLVVVSLYRNDLPNGSRYCGYAYIGPPSSEVAFSIDKIGCACGQQKLPINTLWHEVGHVMGMRHTPQAGHHLMAPMLEDRCATTPSLSPQEQFHIPIANHRPFGNLDVDRDPSTFLFLRGGEGRQPAVACVRKAAE